MRILLLFVWLFTVGALCAQNPYQSLDTIKAPAVYDNIYSRPLYSDSSEVSSFVIFIRKEVKAHKHEAHAEHVVVLDGIGMMTLGDKKFKVMKGDMIYIPKNTFHSVQSISKKGPLKVLSIQTPWFDGKDRVFKEN